MTGEDCPYPPDPEEAAVGGRFQDGMLASIAAKVVSLALLDAQGNVLFTYPAPLPQVAAGGVITLGPVTLAIT